MTEFLGEFEGDDQIFFEVAQHAVEMYDYAYKAFTDDPAPEAETILQVLTEYVASCLKPLTTEENEIILSGAAHLTLENVEANTVEYSASELAEMVRKIRNRAQGQERD